MQMQSEQIHELAKALAAAQAKIENAALNKTNPHFKSKYADLASVIDSARVPLSSNGLAISQTTEIREGGMVLRTTLMHAGSGQWIASEYPLPQTARPQELGSALTYARRYCLSSIICNSADEDDDANAAEGDKQKIETNGRAVKPLALQKPPASKYTKPVELIAPVDSKDWIPFGQEMIAGVKATGEPAAWATINRESLARMKDEAPKVYDRLMATIAPQEAAE